VKTQSWTALMVGSTVLASLCIATGARAQEAAAPPAKTEQAVDPTDPTKGLVVGGYIQGQYESHQDSEDQVRQGGALLNRDRFLVRRARLKLEREWEWSSLMLELDGNTTNGPSMTLHHAEASVLYRGDNASSLPPMVKLTFGMFDTPFGYELVESPRTRFFMERSVASRAFFPSEPDVGVRLSGALGWFRYSLAYVNGQPKDVKDYPLQDPNAHKDFVARVGGMVTPSDRVEISFGTSFLAGNGFHKGTDATKNGVVWKDANENGQVDAGELQALPGQAATPSQNFDHWAIGGDLRLRLKTRLGWTQLYGELQLASNLDRSLVVADPVLTGNDYREIGWSLGFVQEVGKYAAFGFRTDFYNPNGDFFALQGGKNLPSTQKIRTFSPMVAAVLPGRARLVFQYDATKDYLARDARGVPVDLKNNAWFLRLQVEL
jgi:hypothetical protein